METLAGISGMDLDDPWRKFQPGTVEERACTQASLRLKRRQPALAPSLQIPASLPWGDDRISTQAALGRFLSDLKRAAPEVAHRGVTCSPDVASSTNLAAGSTKPQSGPSVSARTGSRTTGNGFSAGSKTPTANT
ncbi:MULTISPECIES: hypothetical protein [unclassified Arthrobacter]|uniref:hypothetical protein n=1 Tax=unclassified Arthrobacter TaxID=235627 RepID=UPI001F3AE562|nr:hypothetical protein [Arthrobacter sp. FW305-BF8]UKA56245.1 hypothetical protein LFT45_10240 [Arthrobacter sp. FW305-BF8]